MENDTNNNNFGIELAKWQIPEYNQPERTKNWYILASIFALLMLIFSFITANFLFAVIIIISAVVIILNDGKKPGMINAIITSEGVMVGNKFYDYDEIKDFALVYKPRVDIKNLYFEFKSPLQHRLTLPLGNVDPLPIRQNLLKYLPEDLERENIPLSESLAKMFKL